MASTTAADAKYAANSAFRRPPPLVAAVATSAPPAPSAGPTATSPTQRTTSPVMRHNPYGMPQTTDRATSPTIPANASPILANGGIDFGMVARSTSPLNAGPATAATATISTANRPYSTAYSSRGTSPLQQQQQQQQHYGAVHRNYNAAPHANNNSFGYSSSPVAAAPSNGAHNSNLNNSTTNGNVGFSFNAARIASGTTSPLSFAQAAAELNFLEEVDALPTATAKKATANTSALSTDSLSLTPSRASITKVYQNGRPIPTRSANNSANTSALSEQTGMQAANGHATVIMSADTDEISYSNSVIASPTAAANQQQRNAGNALTANTYMHSSQQLRRNPMANQYAAPSTAAEVTVAPVATEAATPAASEPVSAAPSLPDLIVVNVAFRRTAQQFIVRRASQLLGIPTEPMLSGAHVMVEGDRGVDLGRITSIDRQASAELMAAAGTASPSEFGTLMNSVASTVETPGHNSNSYSPNNSSSSRPRPVCRLAKYPFVLRNATQEEVNNYHNVQVLEEARACQYAADQAARNLPEGAAEIIDCTFQYDRNKLTLWYMAPERVYFVPLLKVLNQRYRCRIWMERVVPPTSVMVANQYHHVEQAHHQDPCAVEAQQPVEAVVTDTPSRALGQQQAATASGNGYSNSNSSYRRRNNNNYANANTESVAPMTNSKSAFAKNTATTTTAAPAASEGKHRDYQQQPRYSDRQQEATPATAAKNGKESNFASNSRQQQQSATSTRRGPNAGTYANGHSATKKRLTFDD
eukprot:GILI01001418.1.p1 GENE.GILI01001418.1~~GILI01001418.1.p1  ORF type:complete len:798 (+),score=273.31 GILI01001418.1:123-2396(+)